MNHKVYLTAVIEKINVVIRADQLREVSQKLSIRFRHARVIPQYICYVLIHIRAKI